MKLEAAIILKDLEGVKEELTRNPSGIEERNKEGVPLCLLAAKTGELSIVKYIVEYSRASMNTVDEDNRTILHYAAMSGNVELNRYLIQRVGMDICAGDCNLVTPYQIAYEAGHKELLSYYETCVGAPYEEMYHNPIRTGMFPDPSIVRVGEDYYMVNSSFIFFPCIPVSHSRDLIHWEIIGYAITNPKWAKLEELEGGRGYWAPDISYDNGIFYITATYRLNDTGPVYRRQIVVSSVQPGGPYSEPAWIEEDGIDPSIFHEEGRHYMLLNRGARIFELSSDCKRQISEAKLLYYGFQKRAPEGPHLLKKNGYYYLFLAEGGTGPGHRITAARSRELMGPYEPCPYNPIMRQTDERAKIQRCGHGKPVCTQHGEWFMVYLCGRMVNNAYSILGRETAMDPISWTADGWPVVNDLKGPSVLQKCPRLPQWEPDSEAEKGWNQRTWISPREPEEDGVEWQGSRLILKGSRYPLSDVRARNILVRRQTAFSFRAAALLKVPDLFCGQETGITGYYDENTWVCFCLSKDEEGYFLQVKEHIGEEDIFHEKRYVKITAGNMLALIMTTKNLCRTFYYDSKGTFPPEDCQRAETLENVCYLCDEGIAMGKRFTGAMVGMYGYGGEHPLFVEFEDFYYREGEAYDDQEG